jgi:parallel beta-helix repeat protein
MTCTISGVLRNLNGDVLPNATMRITRRSGVVGIGDAVVIPNTVDVTADGSGAVLFDAYPGEYDGRILSDFGGSGPFLIGVPDEATADLDDLIDQGAGALTPELVQRAEDAADRAEAAANSKTPQHFGWSALQTPSQQRQAIQRAFDAELPSYYFPAGVYTVDAAVIVKADNTLIYGDGKASEIKLADNIQRQNVIEAVGFDNIEIRDIAVIHNADRGGEFSRHAPGAALIANSGLLAAGAALSGATTITLDGATVTGSVNGGDTLSIGGAVYTITNSVTAASNTLTGVTFTPGLAAGVADNAAVGIYQFPRYQAKAAYSAGVSTITLDCARIVANPSPFAATRIRVGEQFQFQTRVSGSLIQYEIDPANTTVYTVVGSDVSITAAGIGNEFQNIQITPALTASVAADQYITSIQDANNRYSCGIYLGNTSGSKVRNCRIYGTPMHGILIGSGPITAIGNTDGGEAYEVSGCEIEYFGGNAVAASKTTRGRVQNNSLKNSYTAVSQGIQLDDGCDNAVICGNEIEDVFYGIMSYSANQLAITGNTVKNALIGILFDATANGNTISGNTIVGGATSARGIMLRKGAASAGLPYSNTAIVGNAISGIAAANGYGIFISQEGTVPTATIVDDNAALTISGNSVYSTGSHGIFVSDTRGATVAGNDVFLAGGNGIRVAYSEMVAVTGNSVRNSGAAGVYAEETRGLTFAGNISERIPFSTTTMTYGLEFGTGVTDVHLDASNRFIGNGTWYLNVPAPIQQMLAGSAALDFPSIAAGAAASLTMTVTGAAAGDIAIVGPPATGTGGLTFTAFVSAANTVTVRAFNPNAISVDSASLTFGVIVYKVL